MDTIDSVEGWVHVAVGTREYIGRAVSTGPESEYTPSVGQVVHLMPAFRFEKMRINGPQGLLEIVAVTGVGICLNEVPVQLTPTELWALKDASKSDQNAYKEIVNQAVVQINATFAEKRVGLVLTDQVPPSFSIPVRRPQ